MEVIEALGDAGRVGTSHLNVLPQELACADALPLEVLSKSLQVFLTARTWGTHQENAAHLVHLDFLEKELERVLGSLDDELLEVVLKEFVDLMLVQVLLNRLHVVELLHFIHLAFGVVSQSCLQRAAKLLKFESKFIYNHSVFSFVPLL